MYPSDFEAGEAVYSRVDEPMFLGLPPLLALILFLLLLAVAAGMFFLGRWHMGQTDRTDADKAPAEIHKKVLAASSAAMAASTNELATKAQALRDAIKTYLGAVLAVGAAQTSIDALDVALGGHIEEPAHPEEPHHPPAPPAPTSPPTPPVSVTQVFVGNHPHVHQPQPHPPHEPHPPHGAGGGHHDTAAKPVKRRPMTTPEQTEHLSRAVRAFHDHWSQSETRITELEKAQTALLKRPR